MRMMRRSAWATFAMALLLWGAGAPLTQASPAAEAGPDLGYPLGPGDVVDVRVLDEEELSGRVRISQQGELELAVLGKVAVGGLSTAEAAEKLEGLLAVCCLVEPDVVVQVVEFRAHTVEVLGNVGKPGPVVLTRPEGVLQVLALAGGLSEGAAQEARLIRRDGSRVDVDLHALLNRGAMVHNHRLLGGDVLFVPGAVQVAITGEVKKVGRVPWSEGLTVVQALSEAGGPTENAAVRRIQVIRTTGENAGVHRINLRRVLRGRAPSFLLKPDDTIWVPRSAL
jgi:polysaccharide export outer membrane protein